MCKLLEECSDYYSTHPNDIFLTSIHKSWDRPTRRLVDRDKRVQKAAVRVITLMIQYDPGFVTKRLHHALLSTVLHCTAHGLELCLFIVQSNVELELKSVELMLASLKSATFIDVLSRSPLYCDIAWYHYGNPSVTGPTMLAQDSPNRLSAQ